MTRLPGYPKTYVPGTVAAAALLLVSARSAGLLWEELNPGAAGRADRGTVRCSRARVGRGGVRGRALGAASRQLLTDARMAGVDGAELAHRVLLGIPLGTVV